MGKRQAVVGFLACFAACGSPAAPAPDASVTANSPAVSPANSTGYVVSSVDDRGLPRFLWSTTAWVPAGGDPVRAQITRVRAAYGVPDSALATLQTVRTVGMANGASVTTLRHELQGVEVFGADVSVLLRGDHSLVAISGAPHAAAAAGFLKTFPIAIDNAVVEAIASITGERATVRDRHVASGRWSTFELLHPALSASDPVRARPVYFADGAVLRPAYVVEVIYARTGSLDVHAARRVIAADSGTVLYCRSARTSTIASRSSRPAPASRKRSRTASPRASPSPKAAR